jgi:hypothetical protein
MLPMASRRIAVPPPGPRHNFSVSLLPEARHVPLTISGTAAGQGSAMLRGTYRSGAVGVFAVLTKTRAALAIVGCAFVTAGCNTSGQPVLDLTVIGAPGVSVPRTVAFESIDGPPEPLFRRLVARLTQEATARQIAVVSREQPAQYRIRGYVAAHVQGQRTTITWVWDVFTADRQRTVRLTGEVPGAPLERAWAAADDAAVTRIAQDGMSRLAVFLAAAPEPAPSASVSTAQTPLAFLPALRP